MTRYLLESRLHAFVEIGEDHGGMCFGDGVQYATGCTLGKGNMEKTPYGKLAVTLIERATNRAVRVSYKPTLAKQIAASPFMVKREKEGSPRGSFMSETFDYSPLPCARVFCRE